MPGRVRYEDLPASLRWQVGGTEAPKPPRNRAAAGRRLGEVAPRLRCRTCRAEFRAWAPAQRHSDDARHRIIEMVFDPP